MNRADAVESLIQRVPSIVRQSRLGDQNALAIIATVGEMGRAGHPGAKAVAMAIANHIEAERVGIGGRAAAAHVQHRALPKKKEGAVAKAKAHALALAKHRAAHHKAGSSVLAPRGKYRGGGGGGGGSDDGGGGGGGGGGSLDSADDMPDDGSADGLDDTGNPEIDSITDSAINGEPEALDVMRRVFIDAHAGKPEAQALARAMHEYIRKSRLHGRGAVATVVALANGPDLSKERLHKIGAQFGAEGAKDYYIGLRNPHANIPANTPVERVKCLRFGQCVGIARALQLSRMRNAELRRLHPSIGWEAGE